MAAPGDPERIDTPPIVDARWQGQQTAWAELPESVKTAVLEMVRGLVLPQSVSYTHLTLPTNREV